MTDAVRAETAKPPRRVVVWHLAETPMRSHRAELLFRALVAAERRGDITYARAEVEDAATEYDRAVADLRAVGLPDVIFAPAGVHSRLADEWDQALLIDTRSVFDRDVTNVFVHDRRGSHVSFGYDGSSDGFPGEMGWRNWPSFGEDMEALGDFLDEQIGEGAFDVDEDEYFDQMSRLRDAGGGAGLWWIAWVAVPLVCAVIAAVSVVVSSVLTTPATTTVNVSVQIGPGYASVDTDTDGEGEKKKTTRYTTPLVIDLSKQSGEGEEDEEGGKDDQDDEGGEGESEGGEERGVDARDLFDLIAILNEIAETVEASETWHRLRDGTAEPEDLETLEEFRAWLEQNDVEHQTLVESLDEATPLDPEERDSYATLWWLFELSRREGETGLDFTEYLWNRYGNLDPVPTLDRGVVYVGGVYEKSAEELHLTFVQ